MEQLFLDSLSQHIMVTEEECLCQFNKRAAQLFPVLTEQVLGAEISPELRAILHRMEGNGGEISLLEGHFSYSVVKHCGKTMYLLEKMEETRINSNQIWGAFQQIRNVMNDISVQVGNIYQGDAGNERFEKINRDFAQIHRVVSNAEILHRNHLSVGCGAVDLTEILRTLMLELIPLLEKSGITIEYDFLRSKQQVMVVGNIHYIRKVILGLISNAGQISNTVMVKLHQTEKNAYITVKDGNKTPLDRPLVDILAGKTRPERPNLKEGAGMGLPTIGMIMQDMGGSLLAQEGKEGGLEISLCFADSMKQGDRMRSPQEIHIDNTGGFKDYQLELAQILHESAFSLEDLED